MDKLFSDRFNEKFTNRNRFEAQNNNLEDVESTIKKTMGIIKARD